MGLISGATGVVALLTPFLVPDVFWPGLSPIRAILMWLPRGDIVLLSIAAPSLLAIPIAAWQVRRLAAPSPTRAENVLAYVLSSIFMMLPLSILSVSYFADFPPVELQLNDVLLLAAFFASWCAAAGNVGLLVRNRLRGVAPGVVAEAFLLLGYLPGALFALIFFSGLTLFGLPGWNWDVGAYIVLATCVLYAAQVFSLLRNGRASTLKFR